MMTALISNTEVKKEDWASQGLGVLMRKSLFFAILIGQIGQIGCVSDSSRWAEGPVRRPLPFEARAVAPASGMKPRLLVVRSEVHDDKVPEEWRGKAERELWRQLERSSVYALLKPADIGMNESRFKDPADWNWDQVVPFAREKNIPLVLEWSLSPILLTQEADSMGIARTRRREITIQVKARLIETRKNTELASPVGEARQRDQEVIWFSKQDGPLSLSNYSLRNLEELLNEAVGDLTPPLLGYAQRVNWSGRVALVKGDRIYVNVGRQSGLQVGDILKVLDKGDEVFDPETGDLLGKVPGRIKGTLEVISYFGQDGSIAVIHSGAGFQENDAVEFF